MSSSAAIVKQTGRLGRQSASNINELIIMKLIEEIITPAKARVYLDGNTTNRPLSKKHVDYLAREINGGRWQFRL